MPQTLRIPVQALRVVEPPPADVMRIPVDQLQAVEQPSQQPGARGPFIGPAPDKPAQGYWEHGPTGDVWHAANGADDLHRGDNSVLGLPPELAVVSGMGVGRAVLGEGLSMAGRAVAGAKAVAAQAAPALKYEATKTVLESAGLPSAVAIPIAMGVAGYSRGGKPTAKPRGPRAPKAAPVATEPVAAPEPVAAAPAPQAPPAVPSAPETVAARPSGSEWSPQRIRNEVGMAARRSGAQLSDEQMTVADRMVGEGVSPADAVRAVAAGAPPVAAPVAAADPAAAAARFRLTAAEAKVYGRLRQAGKSHQEAQASIEMQRELAAQLGTPSGEAVRTSVAERNATGRWQP